MKRILVLLIIAIVYTNYGENVVVGQHVNDGIYEKENIPGKRPVPHVKMREADVVWSQKIWQTIDCREKMNHIFYFPLTDLDDRRSLISLLIYGINNEGLTAYGDDEFKQILTRDEVFAKFDALPDTQQVQNPTTGILETRVIEREINFAEVKAYEIKELWYFDRQHSVMRVRILGICPIRKWIDEATGQPRMSQPFWIYFDEARPLFAKQEVFNKRNDAQRVSFDDVFWQRRFTSYIRRQSNVYNNRGVFEYMNGVNQLMEAQKIKQDLFDIEHDLWEY